MYSNILDGSQQLLAAITISRFDLATFAIGLMVYIILFSSRKLHRSKESHKTVDKEIASEDSEVIDESQGTHADLANEANTETKNASSHLMPVLQSMQCFADADVVAADMGAFLEKYPNYKFTLPEVQIVLDFSSDPLSDKTLADRLLEHMLPSEEWKVLYAFFHFYMDSKQSEKACDIFEMNYATFFDIELDEHTEWRLLMVALQCGRHSLAEHLLQTSQSDVAKRVTSIQQWWRRTSVKMVENRVAHVGDVFNRLSNIFNERYPFEEHSDDESTCFLGDDSDRDESKHSDSDWDDRDLWS